MLSSGVGASSAAEAGVADKNRQTAASAEARRQAERARGVGTDAAARLEQQGRARPSSSQNSSGPYSADLFGARAAADLRATLRTAAARPPRADVAVSRPVGDGAAASSATAARSSALAGPARARIVAVPVALRIGGGRVDARVAAYEDRQLRMLKTNRDGACSVHSAFGNFSGDEHRLAFALVFCMSRWAPVLPSSGPGQAMTHW